MQDLLKLTIDAYGGLSRWEGLHTISAHLKCGGITWNVKGHPAVMDDVYVTVDLKKQWTSHYPFINPDWHTVFEANEVAIANNKGQVIESMKNPRASFKGQYIQTAWSNLQLVYFSGYAVWTYFNAPFNFAQSGYEVSEIEPWKENGEIWRRLLVKYPDSIATHGSQQLFYIDAEGLIKRHDYDMEVLGGSTAVHYSTDFTVVEGIKLPTQRKVYVRNPDNTALAPYPLLVSFEVSEISIK